MTLNKKDIVKLIAEKLNLTYEASENIYDSVSDVYFESLLRGDEIKLGSLGKFSITTAAARVGHNPKDPTQKINIPSRKKVHFSASKTIKEALNV
jgi:nucleoid DNA-binding protein